MQSAGTSDFDVLLKYLARGLGDTQTILDAQALRDIAMWHEIAGPSQGSAVTREFARHIHPSTVRLAELRIRVDIGLERKAQSEGEVRLNIAARPIHSFYRSRFGAEGASHSRIDMVCETVPTTATGTVKPDQDRETSDG